MISFPFQIYYEQLQIIFEDNDYTVINKPSNLHIDRDYEETVEKYFLSKEQIKVKFINQLDSATSGVMILGKTKKGASIANKLFMKRDVSKYYILLLQNQINYQNLNIQEFIFKDKKYNNITINQDKSILVTSLIDDDESDEKQFKMKNNYQKGKFSQTLFYPINNNQYYNQLFLVKLLTGRRHQIRLHSLFLGSTIKNDITYGNYNIPEDSILYLHSIYSVVKCINNGNPLIAKCQWIDNDLQNELQSINQ